MMHAVNEWVRAVNPRSLQMETVLILGHRKGEYVVTNGVDEWSTWMVRKVLDDGRIRDGRRKHRGHS